jgi:hypothetical protein
MKCFICKDRHAETIFSSLACCMICYGDLRRLEREAKFNGKDLVEYIQVRSIEKYRNIIQFF